MVAVKNNSPLDRAYRWERQFPDLVFLRQSLGDGSWESFTWSETMERVRKTCAFIKSQELVEGDRIGIWSANSADWIIADMAIMMAGCISVPLYASQDKDVGCFVVEHSELKMLFVGAFAHMHEVDSIVPASVPTVAMRGYTGEAQFQLPDIIQNSKVYEDSPSPADDSPFTIIYSSGTTGQPKGVLHSFRSVSATMDKALELVNIDTYEGGDAADRARLFSYLPLSHVAERLSVEMSGVYANAEISFSAGLDSFADEIRSVQPTFLFSVPRLWARFKAGVDATIPPEKQRELGSSEKAGVRQQLGFGAAKYLASAAAPLSPELHSWYIEMGMPLYEGYSMTETFGIGTAFRSDDEPIPGSVGKGQPLTEVRIAESGEVELRNDALMLGYYKNEAATKEVISDGWYKTGDSGYLDDAGQLWITGRMGAVFKTSKGKFIHPESLEDRFSSIPELGQIMVFGHGFDQPALIVNLSEYGQALSKSDIAETVGQNLQSINSQVATYEKVNLVLITNSEWTVESGLITPTLKVKRKQVESHYQQFIGENLQKMGIIWESN